MKLIESKLCILIHLTCELLECVDEVAAHRVERPHAKGVLCDTSFLVAHEGGKR